MRTASNQPVSGGYSTGWGGYRAGMGYDGGLYGTPGWTASVGADSYNVFRALGACPQSGFELIASMAVIDPSAGGNPILLDETGCREMLEAAYEGRVDI